MNPPLIWNRALSNGSVTLEQHLACAISDYRSVFGRDPAQLVVPFWRGYELGARLLDDACQNPDMRFRGVAFKFSVVADCIELRGSP